MGCANAGQSVSGQYLAGQAGRGRSLTLEAQASRFHQQYCINGKLGRGAFAYVYAAVRCGGPAKGDQRVAVKILDLRSPKSTPPGSPPVDAKLCRDAEREAALMRLVTPHKHCVDYIDSFMEGHFSYLVMERCPTSLLQALDRSTVLNEHTLARAFRDMLRALVAIHAAGVVHRDVKPDNFLCTSDLVDGSIKLCDFGLADAVSQQVPDLTGIHGTAPFMSVDACRRNDARATWALFPSFYTWPAYSPLVREPLQRT